MPDFIKNALYGSNPLNIFFLLLFFLGGGGRSWGGWNLALKFLRRRIASTVFVQMSMVHISRAEINEGQMLFSI